MVWLVPIRRGELDVMFGALKGTPWRAPRSSRDFDVFFPRSHLSRVFHGPPTNRSSESKCVIARLMHWFLLIVFVVFFLQAKLIGCCSPTSQRSGSYQNDT